MGLSSWIGHGGRYEARLPSTAGAGRYTIYIRDRKTGEEFKRSAYRTSDKWGYLQDFKLSWKGKQVYLSDLLDKE
jgi:hypothetical protein